VVEEVIVRTGDGTEVRYRTLPDCPGYRIGSDGSVWSCWNHRWGMWSRWRRRKANPGGNGYPLVSLRGRGRVYVRRLVLEAFIGPCPAGMEACHNNDNRADNRPGNLRWDSHAVNTDDAFRNGQSPRGGSRARAKLTDGQARAIRGLKDSGLSAAQAAREFGVSRRTVRGVWRGEYWTHV
jgi:hypothetical protein